jgi:hypothetical protein
MISERLGLRARMFAVAVVTAIVAVGLAACAGQGGAPAASPTKTVTATTPASQAPASQPAASNSAAATAPASGSTGTSPAANTSGKGTVPNYEPSTVVSKSAVSAVLTSPDPVSKIGAFYHNALAKGGWHVLSSSSSAYSASFNATLGSEGVSISVYPRGNGSGISISTHPVG